MKKVEEKNPEVVFKDSPAFKLKNHPPKRSFIPIDLKRSFGFHPEVIVIVKLPESNNKFVVRAVLTPEELKKHKAMLAKKAKEVEKEAKKKTLCLISWRKRKMKCSKLIQKSID